MGTGAQQRSSTGGRNVGGASSGDGGQNKGHKERSQNSGTDGSGEERRRTSGEGHRADGPAPAHGGGGRGGNYRNDKNAGPSERLSPAKLAWIALIKAKVNAGIAHANKRGREKDRGFPYPSR